MIYNEDFLTGIFTYNIKDVKLVVTSPPYFDARNYGGESAFKDEDTWFDFCVDSICLLSSVLSDDGCIWWNTGSGYRDYHVLDVVYQVVGAVYHYGRVYLIDDIPWIKKSAPPKNISNRPYPAWEHNFIFAKNPKLVKFNRDNVRRPYSPSTISRMKYAVSQLSGDLDGEYLDRKMVKPNPGGATPPNYLILPQDTTHRPHPAAMLPALANWAIRAYSNEGDLILDPMCGIGTTMIESIKLNRKFVGFELVPKYIEIAKLSLERLNRGDDPYRGLSKEWQEKNGNLGIS